MTIKSVFLSHYPRNRLHCTKVMYAFVHSLHSGEPPKRDPFALGSWQYTLSEFRNLLIQYLIPKPGLKKCLEDPAFTSCSSTSQSQYPSFLEPLGGLLIGVGHGAQFSSFKALLVAKDGAITLKECTVLATICAGIDAAAEIARTAPVATTARIATTNASKSSAGTAAAVVEVTTVTAGKPGSVVANIARAMAKAAVIGTAGSAIHHKGAIAAQAVVVLFIYDYPSCTSSPAVSFPSLHAISTYSMCCLEASTS